MKRRAHLLLLSGLLAGCAAPSTIDLKKVGTTPPLDLKRVSITLPLEHYQVVSDKLKPGREVATRLPSPFPDDFPPSRVIIMKDRRPYPSFSEPRYAFPARNVVRFYDLGKVNHERTIWKSIETLQAVMRKRPPSSAFDSPNKNLPDYPTHNASFLVHHKVSYHDYPWGSGVFCVAQFTQGPGNYPNNEEICYQFQGLSKDGRMYVSAAFRITHPILPATIDAAPPFRDRSTAAQKIADRLDQQGDDSFDPPLSQIRARIESIRLPR